MAFCDECHLHSLVRVSVQTSLGSRSAGDCPAESQNQSLWSESPADSTEVGVSWGQPTVILQQYGALKLNS